MKDQAWFEMGHIRKRRLAGSVWIPLRAIHAKEEVGRYGWICYREEFFGAGSIAVPLDRRQEAERLGWMEVGISHEHMSYVEADRYVPCDIHKDYGGRTVGIRLVLEQGFNSTERKEWHLHQDFVISLGLKREGDTWVRPVEGYIVVARLLTMSGGWGWGGSDHDNLQKGPERDLPQQAFFIVVHEKGPVSRPGVCTIERDDLGHIQPLDLIQGHARFLPFNR